MKTTNGLVWLAAGLALLPGFYAIPVFACCPVGPRGKPVVNADQTVIIIWNAKTKTQHFIRKASFKTESDDFGFLIPSPSEPQLNESGDDAFPFLKKVTEPERVTRSRPAGPISCGCSKAATKSKAKSSSPKAAVKVLQQKEVAGFNAVVLEAKSADALLRWLNERGYSFSPEVQAWVEPYVKKGWKITALKVAKGKDGRKKVDVAASSLRMTFKTDRPLFPYREPESSLAAKALGARARLLRIYFLAEARYRGELTQDASWSGKVAWSNKLSASNRDELLKKLKLPRDKGPAELWLTEFEDNWAYANAPADVYFAKDPNQDTVKRPPIIEYTSSIWPTDPAAYALIGLFVVFPYVRRVRGRRSN